jgi:hypothetical protein
MFYKEEDISNELICPKCKNRFEDPRILPCGNSLCQSCILDEIDNENKTMKKCYCCQEKHLLPKEGEFIQNRFILKQLEKKPIKIDRGALGEQLKQSLMEITEKKHELETFVKGKDQIVSDYLSEIRTQIDVITETQIERMNKTRESLLDNLKQYQAQCISIKQTHQEDFLEKIDDFNKKIMKYLSGITWKEA